MAIEDTHSFFETILTAGAILTGFCGTFLSFRIQREANYYRQIALSFEKRKAEDVLIRLTHFTSAFLLLVLATICTIFFGFLLPLFAVAGSSWAALPELMVGGLVAALVLLVGYFFDELVHYEILSTNLVNDAQEWGKEWVIVAIAILVAIGLGSAGWLTVR
jgi:hypothetical protein